MSISEQSDQSSLASLISSRIRADVRAMHAYVVQDAGSMIKLDAMENPHRLGAGLQQELGKRLGSVAVNLYPGVRVNELRKALKDYVKLPVGYELILGNGSDELITLLALACSVTSVSGKKSKILAPMPGFVMYPMSAQLQGLDFVEIPLREDFELDVQAVCKAIGEHDPSLVYLAYPNNPTANLWSKEGMREVIAAAARQGSIVVIDEAYQPFSSHTWLDEMRSNSKANEHVVLMRTLSKFGLAGVRLGYMLGKQAIIGEIDKVRPPYNVSVLNCECALFALEHQDVFAQQAQEIRQQRELLSQTMQAMPALKVYQSDANMILVRVAGEGDQAARVFQGLKERGILVKNVSKMHPLLSNCLRITVGTAEENQRFIAALQESL